MFHIKIEHMHTKNKDLLCLAINLNTVPLQKST